MQPNEIGLVVVGWISIIACASVVGAHAGIDPIFAVLTPAFLVCGAGFYKSQLDLTKKPMT